MRRSCLKYVLCCIPCLVVGLACADEYRNEPIKPIPHETRLRPDKIKLGDRLFHDVRLSGDDSVSCASCHVLSGNGADGRVRAIGIGGATGPIRTPTVYNSRFNFVQFWDGRAANLEEQAGGPIHNPSEMGSNWDQVITKLRKDTDFVREFRSTYEDGISAGNISDAIATFERSLTTPDSPFDRFLRGDDQAITELQKHGYAVFKSLGCIACHQGANVGGNMYGRMGAMGDYFGDRGNPTDSDLGRFNVTGDDEDKYLFKVPGLRLASRGGPYFHDGGAENLGDAINIMARYQLGRSISDSDVAAIESFLESLTGNHPRLRAP